MNVIVGSQTATLPRLSPWRMAGRADLRRAAAKCREDALTAFVFGHPSKGRRLNREADALELMAEAYIVEDRAA